MKLVETDIETPPRIEREPVESPPPVPHRRVAVSFLLTAGVLIATVVTVFVVFPERHNALVSAAVELHADPGELDLSNPSDDAFKAWSIPVVGKGVPWPETGPRLAIIGVRRTTVLSRGAAVVRYRAGNDEVTLVVQRARDTPPRRHRRRENGVLAISWRERKWTFIAAGAASTSDAWRPLVGAP